MTILHGILWNKTSPLFSANKTPNFFLVGLSIEVSADGSGWLLISKFGDNIINGSGPMAVESLI